MQVFGEVAEGLETLTRINEAYLDEKGRPYKNIRFILLFLIINLVSSLNCMNRYLAYNIVVSPPAVTN